VPIGEYLEVLYKKPIAKWLCRTFGVQDLHTHHRLRPVIRYFEKDYPDRPEIAVLEVGSGPGHNLFELAKRRKITGEGYDLDPEHVAIARRIGEARFPQVRFIEADAREIKPDKRFDVVLYIDFLEHVPHPEKIISAMDGCLKPGGVVLVSVPTPRYPRVFGREMHERIGHLLDGYTEETLSALFPANYRMVQVRYSTGKAASMLCALQARGIARVPGEQLRWLLSTPLLALKGIDFGNGPDTSASLFAVFEKQK
jgi:2-polyprenyl-3-methyl-5-hydroxy-6-metoxy-1,4-benzoquinol methylase